MSCAMVPILRSQESVGLDLHWRILHVLMYWHPHHVNHIEADKGSGPQPWVITGRWVMAAGLAHTSLAGISPPSTFLSPSPSPLAFSL